MNRVVHFEIHATDPEKSQKFYQDVFGWNFKQMGPQFGDYRVIATGEDKIGVPFTKEMMGINGGMMKRQGAAAAVGAGVNAFVCIIGVDDVDACIEKAKTAGGTIALEKMKVPYVGDLVYMHDPDANLFGMLQPSPDMMPAGI